MSDTFQISENQPIDTKEEKKKEKKEKKPRKKLSPLKIVLIVILSILLVFALIVGIFIFLLFDGTDGVSEAREGRTQQDIENKLIMDSFQTTKDDGKIRFSLDKADIDQLLYIGLNGLPEADRSFIEKTYVEIDGDHYKFYLQGHLSFIKTRIMIDTVLSTDMTNRQFLFGVQNVTVGKIGGLYDMVINNLSGTFNDDTFNQAFQEQGLSIKMSLKDKQMTYGFDAFANDLINMMDDPEVRRHLSPFVRLLFKNNMVGVENNNNDLSIYLDMANSKFNAKYMNSETPYLTLGGIPDDMKAYFAANPTLTNDALTALYNFLIRGYNSLSNTQKGIVDSLDITSIPSFASKGVAKADYTGIVPAITLNNIQDELQANYDSSTFDPTTNQYGFTVLKESYLNNLFRSVNVVGTTAVYSGNVDGETRLTYITVDDISTNIINDHLYLIIRINFNGLIASLAYDASLDPTQVQPQSYAFTFKENAIELGTIATDEDLQNLFFSYFTDSLGNIQNNTWIKMDPTNRQISFTLEEQIKAAVSQNTQLAPLVNSMSMTPQVINDPASSDALQGDGQIRLVLSGTV